MWNVQSDSFGIEFQGNGYAMKIFGWTKLNVVKWTTTHVWNALVKKDTVGL